jgi:vacuolar-type H+-ATPase subunit F/Vma7
MSRAAVIGEELRVQGYALAGAVVCAVGDQAGALRAWRELPGDVAVVVLTARAAAWLTDELPRRPDLLPVVMPG